MNSQTMTLKQVSCLTNSTSVINLDVCVWGGRHLGEKALLTGAPLVGMATRSTQMRVLAEHAHPAVPMQPSWCCGCSECG